MHIKFFDEKSTSEIDVPPDIIMQIIPGLNQLVLENKLHVDTAQAIISTNRVPLDVGQHLGLIAHSSSGSSMQQQQTFSQSASPLNANNFQQQAAGSAAATEHFTNIQHFHGMNFNNYSRNESTSLNTSPMHQITRGISGLTTACGISDNEPLDLTMEASEEMRPLNLSSSPQQPRLIHPTPPTSPSNNLCIIQEEHLPHYYDPTIDITAQHLHHPQICLTDVQGSEITLVALSDSSRGSDDSLDAACNDMTRRTASTVTSPGCSTSTGNRGISMFSEFLIKEPSSDMPSITRGVGRKASLENEIKHQQQPQQVVMSSVKIETDPYARRGSDKSLGFSDDSLSNDSNQSPAQEVSHSSGFKSTEEERLSPDSLSESRASSDEYYEFPLPNKCRNLDTTSILKLVKQQIINSKMPPKGLVINRNETTDRESIDETSNMSLEYSGGLQIELKICESDKGGATTSAASTSSAADHGSSTVAGAGQHANNGKGIIKLRRISGDQNEYGKLCQQLLTQLTV